MELGARGLGFRKPLFSRLQMGSPVPPTRHRPWIGRFRLHLGKGFAGTFPRHRHGYAGGLLEFVDHALAPFFLHRAINREIAFGLCARAERKGGKCQTAAELKNFRVIRVMLSSQFRLLFMTVCDNMTKKLLLASMDFREIEDGRR
jgi:hypothetical protein